jgi:hypothetical protein
MPAKKYRCTNFANCDAALGKEVIEIEDGEDVVCPTCKAANTLEAEGGGGAPGKKPPKRLLVVAAGVAGAAILAWLLWPGGPDPGLASSLLTDFFPRLK